MMRALSSLIAAVRAVWAPRRVDLQRSQRLAAAPGAWNGQVWASENLPRRPAGVEGVGLGAVAGRRGARVAELDHLLAGRTEVRARSGPVAARALHGPGPRLPRRVAVRPRHEPLVAPAGRLERLGRQLAARGRLHQRRRYPISIRVDADHMIHDVCQHDASPLSVSCAHRKGPDCDNTVMSHTTRADRLLIRSAPGRRTGGGGNIGQLVSRTHRSVGR